VDAFGRIKLHAATIWPSLNIEVANMTFNLTKKLPKRAICESCLNIVLGSMPSDPLIYIDTHF